MATLKYLAATAAALMLSLSAATACDDYEDQMALAAAMDAAKLAQSPIPQPAPSVQVAAPAPSPSAPTDVASAEPKSASTQATEISPGTLRR